MQVPNRVVHCGTIDLIRRAYVRFLARARARELYEPTNLDSAGLPAPVISSFPFRSLYFTGGISGIGKTDSGIGVSLCYAEILEITIDREAALEKGMHQEDFTVWFVVDTDRCWTSIQEYDESNNGFCGAKRSIRESKYLLASTRLIDAKFKSHN